jgi:hypothetical protein
MFDIKKLTQDFDKDKVLLSHIRLIQDDDCPLLIHMRDQYKLIDGASNDLERVFCTVITSIVMQERYYFALTRRQMRALILKDVNLGKYRTSFSDKAWPAILAKLYDLGLFKLIQAGTRSTASIFEVTQPDILAHFETLSIDKSTQLTDALAFGQANKPKN